jgi:hypothetical protein
VKDSIEYLDGSSVSGYKVHDSCSLDSAGIYKEQSFNFLLTYESVDFDETEEGLLGLTRSNDREYDIIIDRLHKSGKISSKVFAVYMD